MTYGRTSVGGVKTITLVANTTISVADSSNYEIFIFGGSGGTYTITWPAPATPEDAYTHLVKVGPGLDTIFSVGSGSTQAVTTTVSPKMGQMAFMPALVIGSLV